MRGRDREQTKGKNYRQSSHYPQWSDNLNLLLPSGRSCPSLLHTPSCLPSLPPLLGHDTIHIAVTSSTPTIHRHDDASSVNKVATPTRLTLQIPRSCVTHSFPCLSVNPTVPESLLQEPELKTGQE